MSGDNIGLRQHFLNYWTTNVKELTGLKVVVKNVDEVIDDLY